MGVGMRKRVRKAFQFVGVLNSGRSGIATCDERVRFNGDGMAKMHNTEFLTEAKFRDAYQAGLSTPHSFGADLCVEYRVRVAIWAAQVGLQREGDFVECGVNSGIFSRAIMEYVEFQKQTERKFYLLDTFAGLVPGTIDEGSREKINRKYPDIYSEVVDCFRPFPNTVFVRGAIPGTLDQVTSEKIAYLSIDMNCVQPEQDAVQHFWPRLTSGAVVLVDDYGFRGYEDQKRAWDAFAESVNVPILQMPTGQAIILKP